MENCVATDLRDTFTMNHLFFLVGLSFILTHEMDAIRLQEWRLFLFLSTMQEAASYMTFTTLHVPLYILLFWGLFATSNTGINQGVVVGLDIFFIVHLLLHLLFLRHRNNQFTSIFSWILILGASVGGILDLLTRT